LKRRTFIKHAASLGIIAAAAPNIRSVFAKAYKKESPLVVNALRIPPVISGGELTIAATTTKIFSDTDTNILSVNNSFPGPTIKLKKGDTFSATVINNLSEPTVLHWHGIHAPADMDGHPKNAIAPGKSAQISYPITQRAGTFFYHSHADMNTARQTYMGMAGCFIIEDDEEKALGLPSGEYDVPLLIQDKRFDANKQLVYAPNFNDMVSGWLGDTILINGTPNPLLNVAQTMYRFRLVNGSNARIYNITFDNNLPFTIIGNDGGLLEKPVIVTSAILSTAERLDILIDFSSFPIGQNLTLKSAAFDGGGAQGSGTIAQGAPMDLLQLSVDRTGPKSNAIPIALSTIIKYNAIDAKHSRGFELGGGDYINFLKFEMDRIDQHVALGDLEKWTFINQSENIHPMHVHGTQFQILDRSGDPPRVWETGWKDVVQVAPFERVNVLLRFSEYTGVYLVHCHNLEHEDMGMMSNFEVAISGIVNEVNNAGDNITINPNPAKDYAVVKFSLLNKDEVLFIVDDTGKIVLRETLSQGAEQYAVIASGLPAGSYTLRIGTMAAQLLIVR
jgi:FtsP/CotA-like multicopper oxidase with cupredoxin domain